VPAVPGHALVVARFAVSEHDADRFLARSRDALDALAGRPGYLRGHLGRAVDDPTTWLLVTEWDGVGSYRRALSAYEVRIRATALLAEARDEPSGFEVLLANDPAGPMVSGRSDRAVDAGTAGPGRTVRSGSDHEERS
jgi:quinol monooxygenase YgiN